MAGQHDGNEAPSDAAWPIYSTALRLFRWDLATVFHVGATHGSSVQCSR